MWAGVNVYLRLLAIPGVGRLVASGLASRLTTSMLSLAILLAAHASGRSYGVAGLMLSAQAVALAAAAPVSGRLADRYRPTPVLLGCGALNLAAGLGLTAAIVIDTTPAAGLIGCAVLVGATTPPSSAVLRGAWVDVVPAEQLTTAYALDAVSNELTFVSGPLVVAVLVSALSPLAILGPIAVIRFAGVAILALSPVVRATTPATNLARLHRLGPLGVRQVRVLLAIAALGAFVYGAMQLGAAATATHFGSTNAAGLALSVLSGGAAVAGLVYGYRPWPFSPRRQLALFYGASGLVLAVGYLVPNVTTMVALFACFGLLNGPANTLEQVILGDASDARYRTETFAWLNSFMWIGYGLGTAAAGRLVAATNGTSTFLVGGIAAILAAALAISALSRDPVADRAVGVPA